MTPARPLIATGLILAVVSAAAQRVEPLSLALIRPDGILVPFAVFDGKTWTAAWSEPKDKVALDGMIEHVPSYWKEQRRQVPLAWHVVRPRQPALQVNVLEHIIFDEQCEQQVGLLTDMHPRREVDSMPYARMLATDKAIAVEAPGPPVEARSRAGPEGRLTLRPLGVLSVGGSRFRIVMNIGYEGQSVSVMQIGPAGEREVLRMRIGGC